MSKRESLIDIGKGLGSILVIISHTFFTLKNIKWFTESFHMSFFFILSGMVMNINKYSFFEYLKKKTKGLLYKYYMFNIIKLIYDQIINNPQKSFKNPEKYIIYFKKIFWCAFPYFYANWFLMSLYTTQITLFFFYKLFEKIFYIIEKSINKKFLNFSKNKISIYDIFLLFLSFFLFKFGYNFSINEFKKLKRRYIFCMDLIPINSSLILFGILLKKNKKVFEFLTRWHFCLIYFFLTYYYGYKHSLLAKNGFSLVLSHLYNFKYYLITSILGSLFSLSCCRYIKENKLLEYIGKNSIIFYSFHGYSLKLFEMLCNSLVNISNYFKKPIIRCLFVNSGAVIHLLFISYIINQSFPWIFEFDFLILKLKTIFYNNNHEIKKEKIEKIE
jgi:fucose 4-O-acetylase-like acetyltransferase